MKHLRQYIRQALIEIYELSPEEAKRAKEQHRAPSLRRAVGLQSKKEIIKDREKLQSYQKTLNTTHQGKKLIKQFRSGIGVTIMHSISYLSYASARGLKSKGLEDRDKPFSSWIRKYGKRGNDVLSTVVASVPIGQSFNAGSSNDRAASSFGFILKGYPVFVSPDDVYSQTLGALPQGLVDHQKHSGVAKRAGPDYIGITEPDFGWAGEALIDNWKLIGAYFDVANNKNPLAFQTLVSDAISPEANLPIHIYNSGNYIGKIIDEESFDTIHKQIFGF